MKDFLILISSIFCTYNSCAGYSSIDSEPEPGFKIIIISSQRFGCNEMDFCITDYLEVYRDGSVKGFQTDDNMSTNFFEMNLSTDDLSKLNRLMDQEDLFFIPVNDSALDGRIYCGSVYKLDLLTTTFRKTVLFDPVRSNTLQRRIIDWFDRILDSEDKSSGNAIDISSYRSVSEVEMMTVWKEPPEYQELIFSPPK